MELTFEISFLDFGFERRLHLFRVLSGANVVLTGGLTVPVGDRPSVGERQGVKPPIVVSEQPLGPSEHLSTR